MVDYRGDLRGYKGQLVSPNILLFVWHLLVHYIDEQLVPVFTNIVNGHRRYMQYARGFYQDQLGNLLSKPFILRYSVSLGLG